MPRLIALAALLLALAAPAVAQDLPKPPVAGAAEPGRPAPAPPQAAPSRPPAAAAQCPDNMTAYAGSAETLPCVCPAEMTRGGTVWGTDTYTADSRTCRAALHAGVTGPAGGPVTVRMLPGAPRYPGTTRNGVTSQNYAEYRASFAFEGAPRAPTPPAGATAAAPVGQCPDNMTAYAGSAETLACLCPADLTRSGSVWGTDAYTADSRTCRAALHAGAVPTSGGPVTLRMVPGLARYPGTTRNGVTSQNYGEYNATFRFEGIPGPAAAAMPAPGTPQHLGQCPDTMSAFAGSTETVTCACPPEMTRSGSVWGTDTYTADSRTCRAALHAGAVPPAGGRVTIEMRPGEPRYPGTTRAGVTSQNYAAYAASFRFDLPRTAGPALCPDNLSAYAGSTEVLVCLCPGERTLSGSVWGTDTYTADSRTCRAAVHAGAIPLTGGLVKLTMAPGAPRYPGTTRNGITSQNYGEYAASYRIQAEGPRATGPVQAPVAAALRESGTVALYITFRVNSADLDPSAAAVLGQVRDALAADPALRLRLVGHTDDTGNDGINIPLSARRADSVRAWLVANGIPPDRLVTEGRGATQPIAGNGSEAGRSLNRRVQAVRVP